MLENITLSGGGLSITKANHSQPYDTISPSRKELSQQGKTILITGATAGIGFAIARAFAQAGPSTIIVSSRRASSVATAVSKLSLEFAGKGIQFLGFACDVANAADIEALWRELEQASLSVDVLVLNAGVGGSDSYPLLKPGQIDRLWSDYETNVRGHLDFAQRFYNQPSRDKSKKLV
jgi:NAD(P)-dependent dehydrogenase (short-subunit alcohol dehydrogenase family)